jgi:hypothetical protein
MDNKEAKEPQEKSTFTEGKDKNGNTVWTATGESADRLAKAFFPDDPFFNPAKETEADKKGGNVLRYIFTYLLPITPFLQLADQIENKYAKKQGWFKLFVYLLPRLIVIAPFFLSGMLCLNGLFNEGWRVRSTSASFGIILVISYFFTSLNPHLTQQAIWGTLITVYGLGYYQLFKNKQK